MRIDIVLSMQKSAQPHGRIELNIVGADCRPDYTEVAETDDVSDGEVVNWVQRQLGHSLALAFDTLSLTMAQGVTNG
jgi:hypothetical protein